MAGFFTMGRQALWVASAVAGIVSVLPAQSTFKLTVFTSAGGYLGTAQVTSTPAGIDCRSESSGNLPNGGTCSANFPAGATVTLKTTPLHDGTFDGWDGACEGQGATCQVVMTQALTTSPKTIAKTYTLTILGMGNASGLIRSADFWARPRLSCRIDPGGVTSGVCETQYPANQTTWLQRDDPMYGRFAGYSGCGTLWIGDPCRLVMDGPKTVTAGWFQMEIIVSSAGGTGTGKVIGIADGHSVYSVDCTVTPTGVSGACSAKFGYPPNFVTLTATPTGNSVFEGWSGTCAGTGPCVIHTQLDPLPVAAHFAVRRRVSEVALALLGRVTLPPAEEHELDQLGNHDGTFNLGDLLALVSRTGEKLSPAMLSAALQAARVDGSPRADRRTP